MTPYSNGVIMPGIEMSANAYETLAQGIFLVDEPILALGQLPQLLERGRRRPRLRRMPHGKRPGET